MWSSAADDREMSAYAALANTPFRFTSLVARKNEYVTFTKLWLTTDGKEKDEERKNDVPGFDKGETICSRTDHSSLDLDHDSDNILFCTIAECLGKSGDVRAIEPLAAFLDREYDTVEAVTAEALLNLGDSRHVRTNMRIEKIAHKGHV